MGHTQLKTRMQGGHVEHRGEIEVKVVQKEKSGGEWGRQKNKKSRWGHNLSQLNPNLSQLNPNLTQYTPT